MQLLRPDNRELPEAANNNSIRWHTELSSFDRFAQVGLSVLLLVGSGLFVRTMQNLRHVDTGINTSHLVTFHIDPLLSGYAPEKVPALHQQILETMATLPGVQSVGATNDAELADTGHKRKRHSGRLHRPRRRGFRR